MTPLSFDIRDIYRAIRLGWNGKKLWIAFQGCILSYIIYVVVGYVVLFGRGGSFGEMWDANRFFPAIRGEGVGPGGLILYVIGGIAVLALQLLIGTMICKMTTQQLKGDDFYATGDARRFLKDRWHGTIFAPLLLVGMVVFFLISGLVIGLIVRYIPYLGEIGFAVLFLPIFFSALLTLFLMVVTIASFLLSPAIVGTGGDDTLGTVTQIFSTVWSQPWRLLFYEVWCFVTVSIGAWLLNVLSYWTLILINLLCGLPMGEKLATMMETAFWYLPEQFFYLHRTDTASGVYQFLPIVESPSVSAVWAGRILSVVLVSLVGFIISYIVTVNWSGQTLIVLALRKRKDGENLLERKDDEQRETGDKK
ncbi:MAG: hypothetical protein HY709_03110 [Candidatus Latescibacteria bacterium]|nr:hypothetical protein [Candidatus Latescibacterota bacterium]